MRRNSVGSRRGCRSLDLHPRKGFSTRTRCVAYAYALPDLVLLFVGITTIAHKFHTYYIVIVIYQIVDTTFGDGNVLSTPAPFPLKSKMLPRLLTQPRAITYARSLWVLFHFFFFFWFSRQINCIL